jgi:hypothetical protein
MYGILLESVANIMQKYDLEAIPRDVSLFLFTLTSLTKQDPLLGQ